MREAQNVRQVATLQPDFMGFIFYSKSSRLVIHLSDDLLDSISSSTKKVGVFVNASINEVLNVATKYHFDAVQLHGAESPEMCRTLKSKGFWVIKAFPVVSASDFSAVEDYEGCCDYYLFDAKTAGYGGSGRKFDWNLLDTYKGCTPFLLSGGIDFDDVEAIKQLSCPQLLGVDLNSRFETSPAMKDVSKLRRFMNKLRNK